MKRLIDVGALGRLVDMEARLVTIQVKPGLREPDFWMYTNQGEGGGILHMEGGHWLTLFRFFSGAEVKSVTALCGRGTGFIEEGLEDVATVALEFDSGVHGLPTHGLSALRRRTTKRYLFWATRDARCCYVAAYQ